MAACKCGNESIVHLLVSMKACINLQDNNGNTPLDE